jgi:tau tubulin kinase
LTVHAETPAHCRRMPLSDARPIMSPLTSASSAEDENLTGCTPALRRRRQSEKYVTDASQLNLQFQRPQHRTRPQSEVLPRLSPRGVPSHLLREPGKKSEESSESDSNSSGPPRSARQPPPPPTSLPPHIAENNARYGYPQCAIFI